jgi:hypothetical protein
MHECEGHPYGADRPHRGAVAWRSSVRVLVPRTSSDRPKLRMVALRASVGSTEASEKDLCGSTRFCTLVTLDP